MVKKFFVVAIIFAFISPSYAQSPSFDDALQQYLAEKGFHGKVLDVQKTYDEDGFIDYFKLLAQEEDPNSLDRTKPQIFLEVANTPSAETATVKLLNKDLTNLPYMKYDWIARFVVRYALNKISDILSLPLKVTTKDGIYHAVLTPASSTVASRFRFEQLDVYYSVEDLILNLEVELHGPNDYLVMEYIRNFINSILRTLENGHIPGENLSKMLNVKSFDSNSLIQSFLRLDEASHNLPEILQMKPLPGEPAPVP